MTDDNSPPDWVIEELERDDGILNSTDREFLLGEKEYKHESTAANRRSRIRSRFANGMLDLQYLGELDDRDLHKTMELTQELDAGGELRNAVSVLIGWLYAELDDPVTWLEETIARGVAKGEDRLIGENQYAHRHRPEVEITPPKTYDVDRIEQQFRDKGPFAITPVEIGILVRSGRLSADDLDEFDSEHVPHLGSIADFV
jgi:hypothetical protein